MYTIRTLIVFAVTLSARQKEMSPPDITSDRLRHIYCSKLWIIKFVLIKYFYELVNVIP